VIEIAKDKKVKSVEELRKGLIELFDKAMREAAEEYRRTGSEEARWRTVGAVVAKRFFAEMWTTQCGGRC